MTKKKGEGDDTAEAGQGDDTAEAGQGEGQEAQREATHFG